MKKIKIFLFLAFVMVILSACNTEVVKINLAEVTRSLFYAPQYVALEKGYFSDEGLEVDLQTTWGGDTTMTALLSGGADIALVGSETSIYVYAQDSKDYAVNFAQLTKTDGTFLVSKEDNPDFSWEEIKGEKFLGQRVGGMPQMVGEYVLKQHGIDPHQDLELNQSIDFANIPGAFQSGDYQYVQLFEPTASIFEQQGQGHIVASFGEESGTVPYTVFMTKQSYLEDNEENIKKFTRAIYRAQQWVNDSSAQEIAEVIEPYFEDTDIEMLAASIERYKNQGSFSLDPILNEEAWENLKNIMDEAGELPIDAPYTDLVNTEIADEIMKE